MQNGSTQLVEAGTGYLGVIQACRKVVMSPKAQLELKLAREEKGSRKGYVKTLVAKERPRKLCTHCPVGKRPSEK